MTRFQIIATAAALIGVASLAFGHRALFTGTVLVLLIIVGCGVAIPRWSLFGPFICQGNTSSRNVALTFDDGPDAASTPALLDLLRDERVHAAFFCVGERVAAHPELAARVIREGHLLENHSYAHSNAMNLFGVDHLKQEMARTQSAVQQATGIAPTFFRPPMGLSNPRVFRAAAALGLKVIGWSVRGLDRWFCDPKRIAMRIARRLEPGAIILLHDAHVPVERLIATVRLLLTTLRERGYTVVRLDKLLT